MGLVLEFDDKFAEAGAFSIKAFISDASWEAVYSILERWIA